MLQCASRAKVLVEETKRTLEKVIEEQRKDVKDMEMAMVYTRTNSKESMTDKH